MKTYFIINLTILISYHKVTILLMIISKLKIVWLLPQKNKNCIFFLEWDGVRNKFEKTDTIVYDNFVRVSRSNLVISVTDQNQILADIYTHPPPAHHILADSRYASASQQCHQVQETGRLKVTSLTGKLQSKGLFSWRRSRRLHSAKNTVVHCSIRLYSVIIIQPLTN
jgi:hypothetical protein